MMRLFGVCDDGFQRKCNVFVHFFAHFYKTLIATIASSTLFVGG